MYRFFAPLRMTTKRKRVILSEAKNLYVSNNSNIRFIAVQDSFPRGSHTLTVPCPLFPVPSISHFC